MMIRKYSLEQLTAPWEGKFTWLAFQCAHKISHRKASRDQCGIKTLITFTCLHVFVYIRLYQPRRCSRKFRKQLSRKTTHRTWNQDAKIFFFVALPFPIIASRQSHSACFENVFHRNSLSIDCNHTNYYFVTCNEWWSLEWTWDWPDGCVTAGIEFLRIFLLQMFNKIIDKSKLMQI